MGCVGSSESVGHFASACPADHDEKGIGRKRALLIKMYCCTKYESSYPAAMGSALAACGEYVSKGSLVLMYALCSASMLIVNKWALLHFPVPAMVTLLQCGSTALIVVLVRATGLLKVEPVSWSVVRSFLSVPVLFALALYTSSQLLHYADAGLQILIRTTTPVVVCIADHLIMGYELPSARSAAALFGLLGGAAFYFRIETHITPAAVFWGALYFISISVEMVWVKSVINRVSDRPPCPRRAAASRRMRSARGHGGRSVASDPPLSSSAHARTARTAP